MRSLLLTTAAAAALGGLYFQAGQAGAQDANSKIDRHNRPSASEPSETSPMRPKGAAPGPAGRSAEEPMQSGAAEHEMKQKRGAQQEMQSHAQQSRF